MLMKIGAIFERLTSPPSLRIAPQLNNAKQVVKPRSNYALLINPFYPKDPRASFGKHVLTPSQALLSIAAATPPQWKVRYWDENLLQGHPPFDPFPAVVGITVHLTFARRAYELSAWYRHRGAKVVLGGPHISSCPEEAAKHADSLAIGEGVQLWGYILHDVEHGELKARYVGSYGRPFREQATVRRDLLDRRDFLTTASLIATRGCSNRCGFCFLSTKGLHMPHQVRDPRKVANEFAKTGEPYGVFTDNNLGADIGYLRDLCRELRPLERIWSAAVTVDITRDPALVHEMAVAGCTGVFVGLETLTGRNLVEANKKGLGPEEFSRSVKVFHEAGIQVNGSFVFGFDHDRPDVFEKTVEWIEANRLECATFHILTPYPETPLFRRLEAEGRLLHRNWDRYDTGHAVFLPKHLSPEELEEGYAWSYKRLFSLTSIWQRRPVERSEVLAYLTMSLLYKRLNWFWPFLIRHRLTHMLWHPLVETARRRHLKRRRKWCHRDKRSGSLLPFAPGV